MYHRNQIIFSLLLCLLLPFTGLNAQCPVTVDAGPNKYVCAAGNTVQLEGSVSGPYIGTRWTPATGLNNPAILDPLATVNTPVTYTLTAAAIDPAAPNLVNNPGFESGNTGFTSGYSFNPLPITPGTYVITTSPALVLSTFPPCDDHTYGNGSGYMMLCNGNGGANQQVWCQSIPVLANTWYTLSAWALSSPISPPVFQFKVNGVNVGATFEAQGLGCVWQEFTAAWFSGAATSANFCIFDVSGSGNGLFGDDFALDDVFMAKACSVSDQVSVSVAQVNAVLPASVVLPCSALETGIVLNGSGSSSGPGYSYSWDGPGIVSGENTLTPTVNETGTYVLTVSFDTGDGVCTKTASITVLPDPLTVAASAAGSGPLTCANNTAVLSGVGSSVGGFISYNWQPASGIVSGGNTLFPVVNQPGEYTLLVTHNLSGCTATATTVVNQNTVPPVAAASAPGTLPCVAGTLTLSGAGSSTGNNMTYQWTGPGIVSGSKTLNNCVVSAPGQYTLLVTNTANGCTAAAVALVTQGGTPPVVMAAADAPGALNCVTPELGLNSTGSSNDSTFAFLWSTAGGHFTGPVNGQKARVDSAGTYILTITNTQNGCTATDTVVVTADTIRPLAVAAADAPGVLNCVTPVLTLHSTGSSMDSTKTFQWTSPDGHFTGPVNQQTTTVDSAGLYVLTVANLKNGCTASDTVAVAGQFAPPLIAISQPVPAITCTVDMLQIDASASSGGPNFQAQWTTTNGNILAGGATLTPLVGAAGEYTLTLTNLSNGCTATAESAVPADTLPPVAAIATAPPGVLNCNTPQLALNNSGTGNDSLFTYLWTSADGHFTGPVNEPTALVDSAGSYLLAVTNTQNGCTATDVIQVIQHAGVSILPGTQTDLNCFGAGDGSIEVFAAGGDSQYTYTWSNGAGTPVLQNLAAGTYTLTVTDGENCSATATFDLSEPAPLLPQAVDTPPSAAGVNDGTAGASPAGGTGPYTFFWSTGATTPMIDSLAAGFYTVTVTDAHACTAVQTVEVGEGNCAVSAAVSAVQPGCAGSADGQALVTPAGGTLPYSYLWNTGGTGALETGLPAGIHTVTVTDLNGCQVSESVLLTDPLALVLTLVQVVPTACPGQPGGSAMVESNGGTGAIGIMWSNGQSGPAVAGLTDGTYLVTATDANGCTDTGTVVIEAIDSEMPVIQASPVTLPLGPSGSIMLTLANLGASASDNCALAAVQWSPEAFDCTDLGVQQVSLTASDVSGNSSTVTIPVTIVDNISPTLECPPNVSRCFDDNVVEYPAPVATDNCLSLGGEFALMVGLPSGLPFPVGSTTITYAFTDVQGNTGFCSFQVTVLEPLNVLQDSIINDNDNQQSGGVLVTVGGSQPGYAYFWTSNGQPVATTEDLIGVGTGEYTLLVTDAAGCTAEAGPFVVSNLSAADTPDWTGRVGVFPNPTTGKLFVQLPLEPAAAEVFLALYDVTGRQVLSQNHLGKSLIALDLDQLVGGFYALSIRSAGQQGIWKIVVTR